MEDVGIFVDIWAIFRPFGIFFTVLVSCNKKNLATLGKIGKKDFVKVHAMASVGGW
jgi:hypothetical protein